MQRTYCSVQLYARVAGRVRHRCTLLLTMSRILLPPSGIRHVAPVAQQIGVPVLATTDAAILRLEPANAAFHLVVGAGKVLAVVALHQIGPQVGKDLQTLAEALALQLRKRAIGQELGHLLTPRI